MVLNESCVYFGQQSHLVEQCTLYVLGDQQFIGKHFIHFRLATRLRSILIECQSTF